MKVNFQINLDDAANCVGKEENMKKRFITVLSLALLLSVWPAFRVSAIGKDTFILDNKGGVALNSPHGAQEGIASMQFTLDVDAAGAGEVTFKFAGLSAEVQEYRYHGDSHSLNVYIAGSQPLFKEDEPLAIGQVSVLDGENNPVEARVSVVEDSLVFVYGKATRPAEQMVFPDPVVINGPENPDVLETPPADSGQNPGFGDSGQNGGSDGQPGTGDSGQTGGSGQNPGSGGSGQHGGSGQENGDVNWSGVENGGLIADDPSVNQGPGQTSNGSSASGGLAGVTVRPGAGTGTTGTGVIGTQTTTGNDGAAFSENSEKLRQLLLQIQSMDESDYTDESFAALLQAADEARHALENTSSTDQELADALMALENAVGALVRKDEMTVVEPEGEEEETSTAEEIPEDGEEEEKEKGGILPVVLTVIAVTAGAAGGIFFVLLRRGLLPWGKKARRDGKWRDITGRK